MAKNGRTKLIVMGMIITLLLALIGGLGNYFRLESATVYTQEKIESLKKEGTIPARNNTNAIGRIETKLESFENQQRTMRTENNQRHQEIMAELRKK